MDTDLVGTVLPSEEEVAKLEAGRQAFLGHYVILKSMASRDDRLAELLRPAVDYMASGSREPK